MDDSIQYFIKLRGKTRGPFSLEQLRRMSSRGQLSRLHQISEDQQTWSSAEQLLSDFAEQNKKASSVSPQQPADFSGSAAAVEGVEWHYAIGEQKMGPVSESEIFNLIQLEKISTNSLLWNPQLNDWSQAGSLFPDLFKAIKKKKRNFTLKLSLVLLLLICLGAGGAYWYPNLSKMVTGSRVVQSTNDAIETEATGMVVFYLHITLNTGEEYEERIGSGTAFVVTKQGTALTNEHVTKTYKLWHTANEEGRIDRLINLNKPVFAKKKPVVKAFVDKHIKSEVAKIVPKLKVHFGENNYEATLEYTSDRFDLAVLKLNGYQGGAYFSLADKNDIPQLTKVVALGYPGVNQMAISDAEQAIISENSKRDSLNEVLFGTTSHLDGMKKSALDVIATPGEVSAVQKEANSYNIQHTAAIRPGNSGGPLVLREGGKSGVVLGINTLFLRDASPVYIAFPVAQMREELEKEAGLTNLSWR